MNQRLILLEKSFDSELKMGSLRYSFVFQFVIILLASLLLSYSRNSTDYYTILGAMFIAFVLTRFIFSKIGNRKQQKLITKNKYGFIQLLNNEINIHLKNDVISIKKGITTSLQFHYFGYKGETTGYFGYPDHFFGTTNYLSIEGISKKFFIYLDSKKDRDFYNLIIEWCLKHQIQTVEHFRNERRYGGKKLSFKEIQAFKEKYKQL